jgi:hypothetical protein
VIFQTLSGILLDTKGRSNERNETVLQHLFNIFLTLNVLQCSSFVLLVYLLRTKLASSHSASTMDASRTISSGGLQVLEQEAPLLAHDSDNNRDSPHAQFSREISKSEVKRGKIMGFLSAAVILFAWILFMTTWVKLKQPKGVLH